MTVEEYYAKASNIQWDACAKLYLSKTHQSIYHKVKGRSAPTPAYFQARAYMKKVPNIINIWIYLSENESVVGLYDLDLTAKAFVRQKQIEEESRKQEELSTGNHSYSLEDFLND